MSMLPRPYAPYGLDKRVSNASDLISSDFTDSSNSRRICYFCCGRSKSCWSGFFCSCYVKKESRPKWLNRFYIFTKSTIWIVLLVCFSLFLLFGPAFQSLADMDSTGDEIFLWLRITMFCFFAFDIAVRCLFEADYFAISLCRGGSELTSMSATPSRNNGSGGDSKRSAFLIGSFLFWCDFISTLTILYDLSFVNRSRFSITEMAIDVTMGVENPESSSPYILNRLALNGVECNVIIVILRTSRCARFVQSRAAINAGNRIDWYGIYQLSKWLNPCSYYYSMCRKQRKSPYQSDIGKDHQNLSLVEPTANATKHNSKGNGGTVALAAVHAESKRKRGERNLRRSSSVWKNLKFNFLKRSDPEMINKYDAASKIQRAWRNRVQFGACADEEQSNPAFEPNRLSVRNPLERRSTNIAVLGTLSQAPVGRMNSAETIIPTKSRSRFQSKAGKEHGESQVRSDMRELLGNRVAIGTLIMLIFTVLCTYTRHSTTQIKTMIVLHSQTRKPAYAKPSLTAAVNTTAPTLYQYSPSIGSVTWFPNPRYGNSTDLTERNIVKITVTDSLLYGTSTGWFDNSRTVKRAAILDIVATIFIIIFWYAGVLSFSGPVMLLVIAPVEQMVRLLGMLTVDPLGYQSTARYKEFLRDDDELSRNTRWSREVLKGMETSFLKSTILRIGSLMKVGFGSAGVEIIQNNLEKGHQKNMLILNSQGTTVSCIFLFSDIRQFTDATEQLQEEVFVFTNRIAAVVHSICNSYGGAANKNIGDAFLLSWSLDDNGASGGDGALKADKSQADKALLSVIKICIALTYDNFFLEPLSDAARGRLKSKLKDRTGSVVQMGFGLHAGKAVQGAIGSQRKIDATYVSESVERAEFLESSTKKYGLKMMMSGEFHRLLHSRTQGRCRKIDHILIRDKDDGYFEDYDRQGEFMDLFTFDMDVDAIQQADATLHNVTMGESDKLSNSSLKQTIRKRRKGRGSRTSLMNARDLMGGNSNNSQQSHVEPSSNSRLGHFDDNRNFLQEHRELVLPSGPALYAQNVWQSPDMRKIRDKYIKSFFFFQKYKSGLDAFYKKDWHHAKRCFRDILEHFDDGPSRYFLRKINENKGVPPKGFKGYGIAD